MHVSKFNLTMTILVSFEDIHILIFTQNGLKQPNVLEV